MNLYKSLAKSVLTHNYARRRLTISKLAVVDQAHGKQLQQF